MNIPRDILSERFPQWAIQCLRMYSQTLPLGTAPIYSIVWAGVVGSLQWLFSERLYGVASRAMFSILSKSRSLHLDIDTQLHLCNSMVVPMMMYGSEVWGYTDLKLIERLQLRFCKIILKV